MNRWLILSVLIFLMSCKEESNQPPACTITSPLNNATFSIGDSIDVSVDATDPEGTIAAVKIYLNGTGVHSMSSAPYTFKIGTGSYEPGQFTLKATARDNENLESEDEILINIYASLPSVSGITLESVTKTAVLTRARVLSTGGTPVTARGICWSTDSNPTLLDNYTSEGFGTGIFESPIEGLQCYTKYFLRAYASNSQGTVYGEELSFTTLDCTSSIPEVSTIDASDIGETSATVGGNVTSEGGGTVTARGILYSSSTDPQNSGIDVPSGNGAGSYIVNLTGLTGGTDYYYLAYATNEAGTAFGSELSFTTQTPPGYPSVTTSVITEVTDTSAICGGSVTSDGGSAVTARGVCWSITVNPTVSDNVTTDGDSLGSFSSNMTGLFCSTTYYVRAYATNEEGTTYGNQVSITTSSCPAIPTISTAAVSNINHNSATSGGNVLSDGGSVVTSRGVCWNTGPGPTTTDSHSDDGSGTGDFVSSISGLASNTTFYVRAFASNSVGTAYGNEISFTTDTQAPDITFTSSPLINGQVGILYSYSPATTYTGTIPVYALESSPSGMIINSSSGVVNWTPSSAGTFNVIISATNSTGSVQQSWSISVSDNSMTDYDGNVYQIVSIGNQVWMKENLKTIHYSDGSAIPLVESNANWDALSPSSKAYCWFNNDPTSGDTYGALYSWSGAMNGAVSSDSDPSGIQGVCPTGWHLPSDEEWKQLLMHLGMSRAQVDSEGFIGTTEGGSLKEAGTDHWGLPNTGATNTTGFTALPGGVRDSDGSFFAQGTIGILWSSTESPDNLSWNYKLEYNESQINRGDYYLDSGFSVRCIKDQ